MLLNSCLNHWQRHYLVLRASEPKNTSRRASLESFGTLKQLMGLL